MKSQVFELKRDLRKKSSREKAKQNARYFKTGKGQYGEGDIFIGLTVPDTRLVAKKYPDLSFNGIKELLDSPIHEERLVALHILVAQYQKGSFLKQKKVCKFYLKNIKRVNNWDLVDTSATKILGAYIYNFENSNLKLLKKLSKSKNLWERRVAIIATLYFISKGKFEPTLSLAKNMLNEKEDLIHKALGWMLREVGKRNPRKLEEFLKANRCYKIMPRTMLRYAIEHFSENKRRSYLQGSM